VIATVASCQRPLVEAAWYAVASTEYAQDFEYLLCMRIKIFFGSARKIYNFVTELPPNQGNQGIQGKSGEKERYFEKSWKIREVLELLLFRFRMVTFSRLSHACS